MLLRPRIWTIACGMTLISAARTGSSAFSMASTAASASAAPMCVVGLPWLPSATALTGRWLILPVLVPPLITSSAATPAGVPILIGVEELIGETARLRCIA